MPSPAPIRVVIVDSSPLCSRLLERVLSADLAFQIAGCAANGRAGLALIESARPDVVCCSNDLALLSGAELVAETMSRFARPILVTQTRAAGQNASANASAGASAETMAMLAAGAIDWVWKPSEGAAIRRAERRVHAQTGRAFPRVSVLTRRRKPSDLVTPSCVEPVRAAARSQSVETVRAPAKAVRADAAPELIAIGASTGRATDFAATVARARSGASRAGFCACSTSRTAF